MQIDGHHITSNWTSVTKCLDVATNWIWRLNRQPLVNLASFLTIILRKSSFSCESLTKLYDEILRRFYKDSFTKFAFFLQRFEGSRDFLIKFAFFYNIFVEIRVF